MGVLQKSHNYLTANLVNILEWKSERLIGRSLRRIDIVEGIHDRGASVLFLFTLPFLLLALPLLEPRHLAARLEHVVTMPTGDWHKWHMIGVVAELLDVGANFLLDLVESSLSRIRTNEKGVSSGSTALPFEILTTCC